MTQTSPAAARQLDAIPVHRKSLSQRLRENWQLYVMLLIPVVLTIVYKYWPMYGIQIAFRDFKASRGITGSEWVGLYWFERFFTAPNCVRMIKNTVLLSLYSLLWSFPSPSSCPCASTSCALQSLSGWCRRCCMRPTSSPPWSSVV